MDLLDVSLLLNRRAALSCKRSCLQCWTKQVRCCAICRRTTSCSAPVLFRKDTTERSRCRQCLSYKRDTSLAAENRGRTLHFLGNKSKSEPVSPLDYSLWKPNSH